MSFESGIQNRVVNLLRERYGAKAQVRVKHGTGFAMVGDPDIYACINGRFVCFEVKNEVGKLTKIQEYRLTKFLEAGAIAGGIRSAEEAIRILEEYGL